MKERKEEGLQALGKKTEYSQNYAPEVLESFENQHPDNDYWVRFNCPEFTTLCPITGQPDFGEIRIGYIPDERRDRLFRAPRRYFHLSVCQLWQKRDEIRGDGGGAYA